jgi:glycosyltransferase involved in cell wall biosynthesis
MRDQSSAQPKVSVVVPLYQNARYVGSALRSVFAQTWQDFEIIVVDDGSSDNGPDIVRAFADQRVSLIQQPNGGIANARNTGFASARGTYIALLDSDDCWRSDKLQRHVDHLDRNPHIGLSLSASSMIDTDGVDLGLVQRPAAGPYSPRDILCRNPVGNGSAPVIRATALDRVRFFDTERQRMCWFDEDLRRVEDVEFFLRLAVGGCEFGAIDEPLTVYRINPLGLSANIDAHMASWLAFRRKVKLYAADLEAEAGDEAEAYMRRYLARRAVRSKDRVSARRLMLEALRLSPRMLIAEPAKTLVTIGAIAAMHVLPGRAQSWLEETILSLVVTASKRAVRPVLGSLEAAR